MTDSARTRLINQARQSRPAAALTRYVGDHSGDAEAYLWDKAMSETKQTAGRPVRRVAQDTYSKFRHRGSGGSEEEKTSALAQSFFTKIAASLMGSMAKVKAPKLKLAPPAKPKTFSTAAKANTLMQKPPKIGKPSIAVVKPTKSISSAMTTGKPTMPR